VSFDLYKYIDEIEKQTIASILQAFNGNVTKTATYFCMNRTTLVNKIAKFGIDVCVCAGYGTGMKFVDKIPMRKISGLGNIKMNAMLEALKACDYNRTAAAKAVGVNYRTLRTWVKHAKAEGVEIPDGVRLKRKKRGKK
jgi:DNA-binding NtrC family response regulator